MRNVTRATDHVPRSAASVCLVAVAVICLWPGLSSALPADTDFADFLLGRDLVCTGTFISEHAVTRIPSGGCGSAGGVEMHAWDYRIVVDDVLSGVAEDSILVISSIRGLQFPMAALQPGSRVIAYANRVCEDGWRLWGGLVIVTANGYIVPPTAFAASVYLRGGSKSTPLSSADLLAAIELRTNQSSTTAFNGASGVALVRLGGVAVDNATQHYTYQCDSLGWAIRSEARVPSSIRFAMIPGCKPYLAPGDTLLLPVPSGAGSANMSVDACPRGWVIHHGYVGGLATPIEFLDYALRNGPTGVVVNKLLTRPGSQ